MRIGLFLVFIGIIVSCEVIVPPAPLDEEVLDGPVEGLTTAQSAQFLRGDAAFAEVFTSSKGLGPMFVANSCASCHAGDGKGTLFTTLTRFGQVDSTGNAFLHLGGPQLQNRAIPGHEPESIPNGASFAKFTPPANTGLGFIDAVSDADILAMADANKNNADGVRGRPNWIKLPAYAVLREGTVSQNGKYIGRFGKKAGVYNLLQQTANAYNQDMGISSDFEAIDTYTKQQVSPEVSMNTVHDVVFYLQALKAPVQRNPTKTEILAGKTIFTGIGCGSCHKESLKTGTSPIEALNQKTFHPYTDMLLHNMGAGLDDGYTEGNAATAEWRTPALWGLGLSPNAQGGNYFLLHDGRAHSIEAAIEMHGGEAETIKNRYLQLTEKDKSALLEFLKSL